MDPVIPFKVLLSLLCVFTVCLVISAVFPESGSVQVGDLKLKFIPLQDVIHPKQKEEKQLTVENILAKIDTANTSADSSQLKAPLKDTITTTSKVNARINREVIQKIEFGDEGAVVLHSFFEKLRNGKSVRILHYGDSQIEGDRMTGFLRQKLQSQFGGTGVGLVIPSDIYNTNAYTIKLSPEWKRYTGFANADAKVKHKKYGVMAAFSRFTGVTVDSLIHGQPLTEAWIEIGSSKAAYGNAQAFNQAKLYYGNCKDTVSLKVLNGETEIHSSFLITDGNFHHVDLAFNTKPSKLKYVFKGKDSPDIYAFSLEGSGGVMVDNIALRGASGTFFNKFDQNLQKQMFDDLEVELFILQFGGNTVPYLDDEKEVTDYGHWLESQMRNLKKLRPGADIIVIGPADMSTRVGDVFITYPLLPKVVAAMKEAAFNSGAAYWDMYSAMGGENSMSGWVEKKLAGDDYTHFYPDGAKYIIQMFYDALMYEYNEFSNQQDQL